MEHGDVVPDGGVEYKHVLLNHGNPIVEGIAADCPDFLTAVADFSGVVLVTSHHQVHQSGFPAAGGPHDCVAFSLFKRNADLPQDIVSRLVANGHILELYIRILLTCQMYASFPDIVLQGRGQLVNQGSRRFPLGKLFRQFLNGINDIASQIQKHNQNTRCDLKTVLYQNATYQEGSQLGDHACNACHRVDNGSPLALVTLCLFRCGIIFGEQGRNGLFCFEAFHHGKAGETVFQRGNQNAVSVRSPALRLGNAVSGD